MTASIQEIGLPQLTTKVARCALGKIFGDISPHRVYLPDGSAYPLTYTVNVQIGEYNLPFDGQGRLTVGYGSTRRATHVDLDRLLGAIAHVLDPSTLEQIRLAYDLRAGTAERFVRELRELATETKTSEVSAPISWKPLD